MISYSIKRFVRQLIVIHLIKTTTIFLIILSSCCQLLQNNSPSVNNFLVTGEVIRKGNLDYLDATTFEYYLNYLDTNHNNNNNVDSNNNNNNNNRLMIDYDIAIMFYAQWCKNCHSLAPMWDQISRLLNAGSNDSKIIMSLFDCESNVQHMSLCNAAGITHYPTILYLSTSTASSSGTGSSSFTKYIPFFHNKKKKHHPLITQFHGNWQYGDSILDWLKTMRFISSYERSGLSQKIRNMIFFLGRKKKKKPNKDRIMSSSGSSNGKLNNNALPIGIPKVQQQQSTIDLASSSTSAGFGSTGKATSSSTTETTANKKALQQLQEKYDEIETVAVRSSVLVETLLFPIQISNSILDGSNNNNNNNNKTINSMNRKTSIGNKTYTDMYTYMNITNSWDASIGDNTTTTTTTTTKKQFDDDEDEQHEKLIIKSCVSELALDYCTKLENRYLYDWAAANPTVSSITDEVYQMYEKDMNLYILQQEPYCTIINTCIMNDFHDIKCKPSICPFQDDIACRYLTACLTNALHDEYNVALLKLQQQQQQLQQNTNKVNTDGTTTTTATATTTTTATPKTTTTTKSKDGFGNEKEKEESSSSSSSSSSKKKRGGGLSWGLK